MRARDSRVWVYFAVCASVATLGTLAFAGAASAAPGDATASQVADIRNPGESVPSELFSANGLVFFAATTLNEGTELWKSNGGPLGAGGTEMVANLNPGSGGSNPGEFAAIGSTIFFSASDGTGGPATGDELWKLDPPYTTPVRVADINPGNPGSSPESLTNVNGTLLFAAEEPVDGVELWKSEAPYTSATQVHDINAPAASFPQELIEVNGLLFFIADDANGYELWKSVSPFTSASMVKDIDVPDPGTGVPSDLTDVNGTLFFAADDGATGNSGVELYKSASPYDAANTGRVEDIATGPNDSMPSDLTDVNGTLFFQADDSGTNSNEELWKSTAPYTAGETEPIEINTDVPGGSSPTDLVNVGGTLFFRASNTASTGAELFKSNGGPLGAGTEMVANINPATSSLPSQMTEVAGQVFFRANDGTTGAELWKSTGSGALLVRDIAPLATSSNPTFLTDLSGTLFFEATDGTTGRELWKATIEGPPPVVTPVTPVTPTAKKKKKCKKKKKKGKKGAAAAKKKKCKKKGKKKK